MSASSSSSSSVPDSLSFVPLLRDIGIKLSSSQSDFTSLLDRCRSICVALKIQPSEFAVKLDAYKFASKSKSFTVEFLDQFEAAQAEELAREQERKQRQRKSGGATLNANPPPRSVKWNQGLALDLLGRVKTEDGINLSQSLSLSQSQTPAKRKNEATAETAANRPRTGIASFTGASESVMDDVSLLTPANEQFGAARSNKNTVATSYNESLAQATAPVKVEASEESGDAPAPSDARRLLDVELLLSDEELSSSGAAYRYMFVDEEALRDQINTRLEEIEESLQYSDEFSDLVQQIKRDRGDGIIKREMGNIGNNEAKTKTENESETVKTEAETEAEAESRIKPEPEEDEDISLVAVTARSQDSVLTAGRICALEDGESSRLTTSTVLLEGDRTLSQGKRVKLTLGNLKHYSLFPGQVIVAKGTNLNGTSFVVDDNGIISDAARPHYGIKYESLVKFNDSMQMRPLAIVAAAGPFTTVDDLKFAPLFDLLSEVTRLQPDLLILMGPFVDVDHPLVVSLSEDFNEFFANIVFDILKKLQNVRTRVILTPSPRDGHAIPVYPQPKFEFTTNEFQQHLQSGRLTITGNPATIRVNDFTIGINNVDLLANFPELATPNQPNPMPRLPRLLSHCVAQQSYFPLFPAPAPLDPKQSPLVVDYSHLDRYQMPVTPDLLLSPSRVKHFVHPIGHDCIGVNPEFLTKGKSAGTFALISVHPLNEEELNEIRETNKGKRIFNTQFAKRTRVDIIKI